MARAKKSTSSGGGRRVKQLLVAAGVIAALVFAVQGGEYGTRDLMRLKTRRASLLRTNRSRTDGSTRRPGVIFFGARARLVRGEGSM